MSNNIGIKTGSRSVSRVGKQLKKARKSMGYTQQDVAYSLGLSRGYVSNIENGFVKPSSLTTSDIKSFIERVTTYGY